VYNAKGEPQLKKSRAGGVKWLEIFEGNLVDALDEGYELVGDGELQKRRRLSEATPPPSVTYSADEIYSTRPDADPVDAAKHHYKPKAVAVEKGVSVWVDPLTESNPLSES
jgi:hypothetical protein